MTDFMKDLHEARAKNWAAENRDILKRLLAVDYAELERRVLAAVDRHAEAAIFVLGVPKEKLTKEQRRIGKAINFGIVYSARRGLAGSVEGLAWLLENSYDIGGSKNASQEQG